MLKKYYFKEWFSSVKRLPNITSLPFRPHFVTNKHPENKTVLLKLPFFTGKKAYREVIKTN